jgi:hypothetical protein
MRINTKNIVLLFIFLLTVCGSVSAYLIYLDRTVTYSYTSNLFREYPEESLFTFSYPSKFHLDEGRRSFDIQTSCNEGFTSGGFPIIGFDIHPNYDRQYYEDFSEYSEKLISRYPGVGVEYLGTITINDTSFHHFKSTSYNNRNIEGIAAEYPGKEYLVLLSDRYFIEMSMNYSPYTCIGKKFDLRNERKAILDTLTFNKDIF